MSAASQSVDDCLRKIRAVLSEDEDFGQQCRTPEELCRLLADGEKLCCILCTMSDGRISPDGDCTYSFYSENSQILARRNVKFFLENCSQHFQIPSENLFEPDDLLLGRRPEKVVATLQKLLLEQTHERVDDSTSRRSSALSTVDESAEAQEGGEMGKIVNEICCSESAMKNRLQVLLQFRRELQGALSLWSSDFVEFTFYYLEEILSVHENYHAALSDLAATGTAAFCSGLGQLFSKAKPQFSIYAKYYSHYPLAKLRLDEEFSANPQLKEQLHLLQCHFKVNSFGVLYDSPLKQMFNYPMMFERLLKNVTKELPLAAPSVESAVTECRKLLNHFNECKRSADKVMVTQKLLQTILGLPSHLAKYQDIGLHRADGQFRVRRGQEKERDCFCLLTDRHIIIAKETSMKFLFNVPITEDLVFDFADKNSGWSRQTDVKVFKVGDLSITNKYGRDAIAFSMWGQQVVSTKAFNFPKGWNANSHHFRLQIFNSSVVCSRCQQAMAENAYQGFHCDHCNTSLDPACLLKTLRPQSFIAPNPATGGAGVPGDLVHKNLDRSLAELMLKHSEPGTFLIREKSGGGANQSDLVLSIRWQGEGQSTTFHVIIKQRDDSASLPQYSLADKINVNAPWHTSLERLVAYYQKNPLTIRGNTGILLCSGIRVVHAKFN